MTMPAYPDPADMKSRLEKPYTFFSFIHVYRPVKQSSNSPPDDDNKPSFKRTATDFLPIFSV